MESEKLRPIVKWAGGKTQIMSRITTHIGALQYNRFIEPFVGGGSVFLSIKPQKLHINDINPHLINMYRVVKDNPEELIIHIRKYKNTEEEYYKVRESGIFDLNPIIHASKFVYLMRSCFRGLYRENSSGKFNTPYGNYTDPDRYDFDNILCVSTYLNSIDVIITNQSYEHVMESALPRDFVYIDPPYMPMTPIQFTKYNKADFSIDDQNRLQRMVDTISNRGCTFLLSNSPTIHIKTIYSRYHIAGEFNVHRRINAHNTNTTDNNEILFSNFMWV